MGSGADGNVVGVTVRKDVGERLLVVKADDAPLLEREADKIFERLADSDALREQLPVADVDKAPPRERDADGLLARLGDCDALTDRDALRDCDAELDATRDSDMLRVRDADAVGDDDLHDTSTLRMRRLFSSPTKSTPGGPANKPVGPWKSAALPRPSAKPDAEPLALPPPAIVVTVAVDTAMARMSPEPCSRTYRLFEYASKTTWVGWYSLALVPTPSAQQPPAVLPANLVTTAVAVSTTRMRLLV